MKNHPCIYHDTTYCNSFLFKYHKRMLRVNVLNHMKTVGNKCLKFWRNFKNKGDEL